MAVFGGAGSLILDATGQWVVLYDAQLRIRHANTAALRVLKRSYGDVIGKTWEELGLPADVMRPLLDDALICLHDGEPRSGELSWHVDGAERWFSFHLARVELEGVRYVVSSKHETTATRMMARDMENYASVAAHDLRGPLISIAMRTQMMRKQLESCPPAVVHHVDAISNTTRRLSQLVDDLMEYSKQGNIEPEMVPHDPVSSIDHALEMLAPSLHANGVTIVVGEMPAVLADATHLTRVWQNLLQNSIRYRSELPLNIEFTNESTDEWVRICVQDNGLGFPAGREAEAFRPFSRLHGDRRDGGAGLGLSVCSRIIDAHGGRMEILPSEFGARLQVTLYRATAGPIRPSALAPMASSANPTLP